MVDDKDLVYQYHEGVWYSAPYSKFTGDGYPNIKMKGQRADITPEVERQLSVLLFAEPGTNLNNWYRRIYSNDSAPCTVLWREQWMR